MKLILAILILISGIANAQGPNTVAGNIVLPSFVTLGVIRTVPNEYTDSSTKKYPLILFGHGAGEAGSNLANIYNSSSAGGPAYFNAHSGWPDSVINPRDGKEYKFIICSPQAGDWSPTSGIMQQVTTYMKNNYRIDTTRIYWVALSAGGQAQVESMNGSGTLPLYKIAAMVTNAGVVGSYNYANGTKMVNDHTHWLGIGDTTGGATDDPYGVFTNEWKKAIIANGGDTLVQFITHDQGHSRFNYYMDPSRDIIGSMNMYEWMIQYQAYQQASPPIVSAGDDITVTLPTTSTTATGTASADGGIASYSWTRISGPNTPTLSGATTATVTIGATGTPMIRGTYVYQFSATGNNGLTATDQVSIFVQTAPSNALIKVSTEDIYDLNGRNGKGLRGLFDGDSLTKYDISGISEPVGGPIFISRLVLPYVINGLKLRYFGAYDTGRIDVKTYKLDRTLIATHTLVKQGGGSGAYSTVSYSNDDSVRFVDFEFGNTNVGLYTLQVYGDSVKPAPVLFPHRTPITIPDPGIDAQGLCQLDNRLLMVDKQGRNIASSQASAVRVGVEGQRFQWFPDPWIKRLSKFWLGRFGDHHLKTRLLDYGADSMGVQLYITGGGIKSYDSTYLANLSNPAANNSYLADPGNNFKFIKPGEDSLNFNSWDDWAHTVAGVAYIFGKNTSAPLGNLDIKVNNANEGGDKSPGQGVGHKLDFEQGNELTRDFGGVLAYHSPQVNYRLITTGHDSLKAKDPTMLSMVGALTYMDTTYWKALAMEHYWFTGSPDNFPADVFCFNLYQNEYLDGQGGGPAAKAVSPETWRFYERLQHLQILMARHFPNAKVRITETGVATADDSPFDVDSINGRSEAKVAADVQLRIFSIVQSVPFIERVFYYAGFMDGSANFSTMSTTIDDFGEPFGALVTPMGYVLGNQKLMEKNYRWFSTLLTKGDTSHPWVFRKSHKTDASKTMYKVSMGSMRGITEDITIPVGALATSAMVYTPRYDRYEPDSTSVSVSGGNVIVTARETPQWIVVTSATSVPAKYIRRPGVKTRFKLGTP